jgi:hypothetical protein
VAGDQQVPSQRGVDFGRIDASHTSCSSIGAGPSVEAGRHAGHGARAERLALPRKLWLTAGP